MPRVRQIQQRTTHGELDPKLIGRNDIDQYYGAAATMQNVLPESQGGFTRRPGMEYVDSVPAGSVKTIEFKYSETDTYLIVVTSGQFEVYKNGVSQVTVTLRAFDSDTKIQYMTWTQGGDTLLLFHEDVPTQKIVRNSDTSWTVSAVTWEFIPLYAFTLTETSPNGRIDPNPDYNNSENLWTSTPRAGVCYLGNTVTVYDGFNSTHKNQYIRANGGYGRIVDVIQNNRLKLWMEIPFPHWAVVVGGDWQLLTGFEPVWSSSRGYPRCGTFHNGRLYIGGSKSLPTTIWGSKVGEYFNFDKERMYDADAIERTLDVGSNDKIVSLYSGRALFALTTGGVISINPGVSGVITPTNLSAEKQVSVGAKYGTPVVEHEGALIYVQSEGASIQELIYDDAQNAFTSGSLSWLSSHLIKNPIAVSLRKSTSTDQGTYLLIVNDDGTATIANIFRSQGIASFVPVTISGADFISCGVDGTDMYFVVDDGTTRRLMRLDFDLTLDSATRYATGFPISSATGLSRLNGMAVKMIVDGVVQSGTVSGGAVAIDPPAEESLVVGLDYDVVFVDLPVDEKQLGSVIGQKKNISQVVLQLYKTQNVLVNGKEVSFVGDGDDLEENPEFTGTKILNGLRGWSTTGQVTITQNAPLKMSVLAITKKVNI
ncbi:MAG: hypothetical protein HGA87_01705 [Desulfobulbaceae bacterium]|nr:hypothetical protein [Desulfobulbaceae bacterium]